MTGTLISIHLINLRNVYHQIPWYLFYWSIDFLCPITDLIFHLSTIYFYFHNLILCTLLTIVNVLLIDRSYLSDDGFDFDPDSIYLLISFNIDYHDRDRLKFCLSSLLQYGSCRILHSYIFFALLTTCK